MINKNEIKTIIDFIINCVIALLFLGLLISIIIIIMCIISGLFMIFLPEKIALIFGCFIGLGVGFIVSGSIYTKTFGEEM